MTLTLLVALYLVLFFVGRNRTSRNDQNTEEEKYWSFHWINPDRIPEGSITVPASFYADGLPGRIVIPQDEAVRLAPFGCFANEDCYPSDSLIGE